MLVAVIGTANVRAMAGMFPGPVRARDSPIGGMAAHVLFDVTVLFTVCLMAIAAISAVRP